MIINLLFTSLFIYGIHSSTRDGMIFEGLPITVAKFLFIFTKKETLVAKILKPLFDCPPCMASVWGSLCYYLMFPQYSIIGWILWIFIVSGFNHLIGKIINK